VQSPSEWVPPIRFGDGADIVKALVESLYPSCAFIVKEYVTPSPGLVPEIAPVEAFSVIPEGRVPLYNE
jgi:hypothetical protein